eukprot:6198908-Pleurochrysis_carterae.AAC.1
MQGRLARQLADVRRCLLCGCLGHARARPPVRGQRERHPARPTRAARKARLPRVLQRRGQPGGQPQGGLPAVEERARRVQLLRAPIHPRAVVQEPRAYVRRHRA